MTLLPTRHTEEGEEEQPSDPGSTTRVSLPSSASSLSSSASSAASSPFASATSLPDMMAGAALLPLPLPAAASNTQQSAPSIPAAGMAEPAAAAAGEPPVATAGGSSSSNNGFGAPSTSAAAIPPPNPAAATTLRLPRPKPPLPPPLPLVVLSPPPKAVVAVAASASPGKRSDGATSDTSTSGASNRSSTLDDGRGRGGGAVSSLAWDISYKLRPKGRRRLLAVGRGGSKGKTLLHSIAGQASAGDLLAVMGASGCGKSTLLKCLSLRDQGFAGGVYLNGAPVDKWYLSLVGFVDQYDLFIPTVTVREHLVFQAHVRLPQRVPRRAKLARVQEVLIELNLGHVAESYIGGGKAMVRGLSGGEKRRLSFATEMIPDPHIIIADEATTGLDASMAKSVCRFLRGRADAGRIVVSSIHQPSSQTFAAFTHILLLAPQGRTAYFGPSARLLEYLSSLGLHCPPYHNLADFAVRCVAIPPDDAHGPGAGAGTGAGPDGMGLQARRVLELCRRYDDSDLAEANRAWKTDTILALLPARANDVSTGAGSDGGGGFGLGPRAAPATFPCLPGGGLALVGGKAGVVTGREYSAAWVTQFRHSLVRQLQAAIRDRKMTGARILVGVGTGSIIGMAFRGPKGAALTQEEIDNTMGFLFTVSIFSMITNFFQVAFTLPSELQVFFRERVAGVNRVSSYLLSHVVAALVFLLVWTAINCAVMLPSAIPGLGFGRFGIFFLTISLSNVCSTALGYLVAVLAQNEAVALALVPALSMPMALFSGLLVNLDSIPAPLQWLKHLSIIKYTLHALAIEEFRGEAQVHCPGAEPGQGQGQQWCKYPDWRAVLAHSSADELTLQANVLALVSLSCLFLLLAYLVLLRHTRVATVR